MHSLGIVLRVQYAVEIRSGFSVLSFFQLPWESNTMESAHNPCCGFPQKQLVHLLAFAYQYQRDMIEIAAEIGNEPFYPMWSAGEMVRVGQDHQFNLSSEELLG
jgi:hypothetical protein